MTEADAQIVGALMLVLLAATGIIAWLGGMEYQLRKDAGEFTASLKEGE